MLQRDREINELHVKANYNRNKNSNNSQITTDNHAFLPDHFLPGPILEANRKCNINRNLNNPTVTDDPECLSDYFPLGPTNRLTEKQVLK